MVMGGENIPPVMDNIKSLFHMVFLCSNEIPGEKDVHPNSFIYSKNKLFWYISNKKLTITISKFKIKGVLETFIKNSNHYKDN